MTAVQEPTDTDDLEAVLALVDSEPVPLDEVDEDDEEYERRAAEHLGDDDPHDESDVLTDVELSDLDPTGSD